MLEWLLDVSNFPLRQDCCVSHRWSTAFSWASALGGVSIASAYYANPMLLLYVWKKYKLTKTLGPPGALFVLYATFIFACGTGHLLKDVMPFWYPNYHLICVWDWATGIVSWVTNFAVVATIVWWQRKVKSRIWLEGG